MLFAVYGHVRWRGILAIAGVLVFVAASTTESGAEEVCECWTSTTCADGVVTLIRPSCVCGEPVEIVENAYQCEKGCRTDGLGTFDEAPQFACEEWRLKEVGDPCTTRRDCLPALFGTYLACDPDTQVCVETEAPAAPDYLAQCGIEDHDVKFPYAQYYGFIPTDACDSGLCLVAADLDCIRQGCSLPCEFPQDCPRGSICAERRDWSAFKLRFEVRNVCAPDYVVNVGILCPAE